MGAEGALRGVDDGAELLTTRCGTEFQDPSQVFFEELAPFSSHAAFHRPCSDFCGEGGREGTQQRDTRE